MSTQSEFATGQGVAPISPLSARLVEPGFAPRVYKKVEVRASGSNTDMILLSPTPMIVPDVFPSNSSDVEGFYLLYPGESVEIPIDNPSKIFVTTQWQEGQKYSWLAI